MAVNYANAVKTPRLQVVADLVNGKTIAAATGAASNGSLVIGTSSLSGSTGVLATIPLPFAGVTVSGSTLNLVASAQAAAATASGTAALAEVRNNAGTVIISGLTVGGTAEGTAGGKDVVLGASTISTGQNVSVTSASFTHG